MKNLGAPPIVGAPAVAAVEVGAVFSRPICARQPTKSLWGLTHLIPMTRVCGQGRNQGDQKDDLRNSGDLSSFAA